MKIANTQKPYEGFFNKRTGAPYYDVDYWPCKWITCDEANQPPFVMAFRKKFNLDKPTVMRVHVTADERYELYIDGSRIGRGSERGDKNNWFYDTYELSFSAGPHVIVARVWALGPLKPWAQISVYPGFIFSPEGEDNIRLLGTGVADWESKKLPGYTFNQNQDLIGYGAGTGAKLVIDGNSFSWGFEKGEGDGWNKSVILDSGNNGYVLKPARNVHIMRPSILPAMLEKKMTAGIVRHISRPEASDVRMESVCQKSNILSESDSWNDLLFGKSLMIPPNTYRRIIIDLENYYCAYPEIIVSGGKGGSLRVGWAESLFESEDLCNQQDKGNRDEIEGKFYKGLSDTFKFDGGKQRKFDTSWWHAGRYIEVLVQTDHEPLLIEEFNLIETRYPLSMESSFASGDGNLEGLIPLALRTMQMCSHETYMDCPYYEQLMYGGDTRVEILVNYTITADDRLARKALLMFNAAREGYGGLTACAYPESDSKVIPSFSLWWISMVYDFSMWRDDISFVKSLMPGVRAVMECILSYRNENGLIKSPGGWDYIDWSQNPSGGWHYGIAPDSDLDVNGIFNWQIVLTLRMLSQLENYVGEPELSQRALRLAEELSNIVTEAFWDEGRGLFADDLLKLHFSEHAQCMAILSGSLNDKGCERVFGELIQAKDLARTSIFYTHYLFEVFTLMGRVDLLLERMKPWFEMENKGFKTLPEYLIEKTRSDCHAWSSHPMYHYFASLLGVTPGSAGFRTVNFRPQLGALEWAQGTIVHPKGMIEVEYKALSNGITAIIALPDDLKGVLDCHNRQIPLSAGRVIITIKDNEVSIEKMDL